MSITKRIALALPILLSGLMLGACADTTAPVEPTPSFEQGGTAPNCWAGYHSEGQGSGGYVCVPNG
jgi:hypothetical protein